MNLCDVRSMLEHISDLQIIPNYIQEENLRVFSVWKLIDIAQMMPVNGFETVFFLLP